jgi:hypothetical protein
MSHLIILPGNSLKNRAWGEAVAAHYQDHFDFVFLQNYDHWDRGEANINLETELEKLAAQVGTISAEVPVTIYAKSIGSILALLAIDKKVVSPKNCAFFGMPLDYAGPNIFNEKWSVLKNYQVETVAFHNDEDSTASYEVTKSILADYVGDNFNFVTTKGTDHVYLDFAVYDSYLIK